MKRLPEIFDSTPPHDRDAERATLGSVLLKPDVLVDLHLSPRDFYLPEHQALWRAIERLRVDGRPIDTVTLLPELKKDPGLKSEHAAPLIAQVAQAVPTAAQAKYYAGIVTECANKRRFRNMAEALLQDSANGKASADILTELQAELWELNRGREAQGVSYSLLTSAQLATETYNVEYLITHLLVAGQPCIIAGPKKSLKTTLLIALAISLATGRPLFGSMSVSGKHRVLVMSGESGLATIQETSLRIAESVGVDLAEVSNLLWSPDLPKFGNVEHLEAFRTLIVENEIRVAFIDPAYLCLPGADAGNLFVQGELLRGMNEICQANNTTLVLIHHAKKARAQDPFAPMELEDIAWAGFQEFARQWLLVNRRERYEPGTGSHRLWLSAGGSAGHSGLWGLDIDEGRYSTLHPRTFQTRLLKMSDIQNQIEDRKEEAKFQREQAALERDMGKVRTFLASALAESKTDAGKHSGRTKTAISKGAGMSGGKVAAAIEGLIEAGEIVACDVTIANHKTPSSGYKLIEKHGHPDYPDNSTQTAD